MIKLAMIEKNVFPATKFQEIVDYPQSFTKFVV